MRAQLEADGWWVARAAGSLGDADLVAVRAGRVFPPVGEPMEAPEVWLIEVKSTAAGPFHSFGPNDRAALKAAAELAGATAWLVWWPPRKNPMWIRADVWPQANREVVATAH